MADAKANIEFLESYPGWAKIVLLVLVLAILAILLFSRSSGPSNKLNENQISNRSPASEKSGDGGIVSNKAQMTSATFPTATSLVEQIRKREGNFYERDKYLESIKNTYVSWDGFVNDVLNRSSGGVTLYIQEDSKLGFPLIACRFDEAFQTQLFALRKGDKVKVTGVIEEAGITSIEIKGNEVEVLHD